MNLNSALISYLRVPLKTIAHHLYSHFIGQSRSCDHDWLQWEEEVLSSFKERQQVFVNSNTIYYTSQMPLSMTYYQFANSNA